MSATQRPSRAQLQALIDVFDRAPYPLLIHCKWGADRTGLASGLYLMIKRGVSPDEAAGELSLRYGHIPVLGPQNLHTPFHEYSAWLKTRNARHNAERLREWVATVYRDASLENPAPSQRPASQVAHAPGSGRR